MNYVYLINSANFTKTNIKVEIITITTRTSLLGNLCKNMQHKLNLKKKHCMQYYTISPVFICAYDDKNKVFCKECVQGLVKFKISNMN
jgi:hypothetical protein